MTTGGNSRKSAFLSIEFERFVVALDNVEDGR